MRRKRTNWSHLGEPLGLTREGVVLTVGSESIVRQLEEHGELEPFYVRKTFRLYDRLDVVRAWTRFRAGLTAIPLRLE